MLVAKLEIWPRGNIEDAYEIKRIFIANLGQNEESKLGDPWTTEYTYATWIDEEHAEWVSVPLPTEDMPVYSFRHDRLDGAEVCLQRALNAVNKGELFPQSVV
jgi:hypothetical protein